jgi:hypothetical protein
MAVLRHAAAPQGVVAGRGYRQVATGRGRLVVVSGQIAQHERGELAGPGSGGAGAAGARQPAPVPGSGRGRLRRCGAADVLRP